MITVWGRRNSMNVQKVMWALGELRLVYQRHDMAGSFGVSDDYLAMNPAGTVPTIRDGDLVLFESNACARYLAMQYGAGSLAPADPQQLALADQWMDWQTNTLSPVFFMIFVNKIRVPAEKSNAEQLKRGVAQTNRAMQRLNDYLENQATRYLVSDDLTMADLPIGAVCYRYFNLDIERPALPALERYFGDLSQRPAYQHHVMIPFGNNVAEWDQEEARNAGIQ